jgi:hypothetical protein
VELAVYNGRTDLVLGLGRDGKAQVVGDDAFERVQVFGVGFGLEGVDELLEADVAAFFGIDADEESADAAGSAAGEE